LAQSPVAKPASEITLADIDDTTIDGFAEKGFD
jgi:hypothetical protein